MRNLGIFGKISILLLYQDFLIISTTTRVRFSTGGPNSLAACSPLVPANGYNPYSTRLVGGTSSRAFGALRIYILLKQEHSGIYHTAHEAPWTCIYISQKGVMLDTRMRDLRAAAD